MPNSSSSSLRSLRDRGISGSDYSDSQAFSAAFADAMMITTILSAVAWFLISDDVLVDEEWEPHYHCAAESTPQS